MSCALGRTSNQVLGRGGVRTHDCADWIRATSGDTFSVTSSVYNYRYVGQAYPLPSVPPAANTAGVSIENGRTYHRYKDGAYLLPNDEVSFSSTFHPASPPKPSQVSIKTCRLTHILHVPARKRQVQILNRRFGAVTHLFGPS